MYISESNPCTRKVYEIVNMSRLNRRARALAACPMAEHELRHFVWDFIDDYFRRNRKRMSGFQAEIFETFLDAVDWASVQDALLDDDA